MSWSEQRRRDRQLNAQIRREDREAEREQDRKDRQQEDRAKRDHAQRRQQQRTAWRRWIAQHPVEVLMVVVIVVPGLLAWSAMSLFGTELYGPLGVLLPLYTEAAMWVFAFRLHAVRASGGPTGWLQVGLWASTAVAGCLNFLHGNAIGGWLAGTTMAVVSVGGVLVHQLISAAPMRTRRSPAQRRDARTDRIAARRITRMQRVAVRHAVGELAADGTVQLLHRPGLVRLRRDRLGRRRLASITAIGLGADGPADPEPVGVAHEVENWLASTSTVEDAQERTAPQLAAVDTGADLQELSSVEGGRSTVPQPQRRSFDELKAQLVDAIERELLLDEGKPIDPSSAESIRRGLGIGRKRAEQLRDDWNDNGTAGIPAAA